MVDKYVPDRGDIVWINFNPQSGREQAGKRPAFVVSPRSYNQAGSLALFCPITRKIKGYPFEVCVDVDGVEGAILVDHIKSLDWKARKLEFIGSTSPSVWSEVEAKLTVLMH